MALARHLLDVNRLDMPGSTFGIAALCYAGLVAMSSCVSFVAYGFDKRRATRGGRRIPERTLHLLALAGGWPGALWGQRHFRHKTRKVRFLVVFWLAALLHVAAVAALAYAIT
ncbi:DUF1294 domain-containing protein [Candidatus Laterigemmans baculatus]|uniref:DUF1294 domain-containing protein n=1 Tax=Candidatus Laterigemmans baculatus TaxID=2770505 RepID=UPI0013D95EBE|nr:DUF1294 domain-containing protein [Candidatus Laterigemmans baculatus]